MAALAGLRHPQCADRDRRAGSADPGRQRRALREGVHGRAACASRSAPVRAIRILTPVEVRDGDAVARLEPCRDAGDRFPDRLRRMPPSGGRTKALNMANGAFVRELCDSRTFCRQQDVDDMRARGLALGGTLDNAVVVEGDRVLSPGGLRHERRAGAAQDAGRPGRSGAGGRADPGPLHRESGPVMR